MQIKTTSRILAASLTAALALSAFDMRPAAAASATPHKAEAAKMRASDATEFSSQRRHYRHGNRAAAGAVLGVFGAVAGIAAAEAYRRNSYRNDGYYDYGYSRPSYGYYAPAPYYGGYYAPRREYFPN